MMQQHITQSSHYFSRHIHFRISLLSAATGEKKKVHTGPSINKIEAQVEAGSFEIQTVTTEFKLALLKARQAKGLSQKELAEKINVKAAVVTEYEQGKAIPDPGVISKLNRALGVTLPKPPKKKIPKVDSDL